MMWQHHLTQRSQACEKVSRALPADVVAATLDSVVLRRRRRRRRQGIARGASTCQATVHAGECARCAEAEASHPCGRCIRASDAASVVLWRCRRAGGVDAVVMDVFVLRGSAAAGRLPRACVLAERRCVVRRRHHCAGRRRPAHRDVRRRRRGDALHERPEGDWLCCRDVCVVVVAVCDAAAL